MSSVWVILESNSGGAGVRGVYATKETAEASFDPKGFVLHHRAAVQTVWKKPDGSLTITIEECQVQE